MSNAPTLNTKTQKTQWMMGLIAAFALGAGGTAFLMNTVAAPNSNDMYTTAEREAAMITPSAGDANTDKTVIARVNGATITMQDYNDYLKTVPEQVAAAPMEQVFPMVQDQLVVGSIISSKATNLDNDPEVQKRLGLLKENVIRATWLERAVNAKVTDAAMQQEYDKFAKGFKPAEEISAQHILVDTPEKAKDVIAKLNAGAKFEDMVKEYSKDKGAKNDGQLGYFKQGDMVKEFADAAFAMKKDETSQKPVKTQFGYHVIRVNDRRMSQAPTFEQLKPQIQAQLQRQALETVIADLRQDAKIELFDAKGQPVQTAAAAQKGMNAPTQDGQAAATTAEPAAGTKNSDPAPAEKTTPE